MADNDNKPNVLLLGGVGFIGRNFVHYLISNDLVSKLYVVDKVIPQMAWLNAAHKESFSKVEFRHANLINPKTVSSIFESSDDVKFDFVINCAAETKLGQSDAVYEDGILKLTRNCACESAKHGIRRYIEVSTAQMLSSDKKPFVESCSRLDPCSRLAAKKLEAEKELNTMTDLNYVIVRPAFVYGPGDKATLTPRLVLGGVYRYLQETMQLLWNKDYKMNTVHVQDVARALWHLCYHGNRGEIYHLGDKGDTTQGKIGDIICDLFNIEINYLGFLASNAAKFNIEDVVEDINEKHMMPWGQACTNEGIFNTPLTPYLEQELLMNKQLCVDGSKIETTGYRYEKPFISKQLLKEVLDDYIAMGLFPASLLASR